MNIKQEYDRLKNVENAIRVISECDAAVAVLNARKNTLISLQQAMIANTADYTPADVAWFNGELSRLAVAIEAIV